MLNNLPAAQWKPALDLDSITSRGTQTGHLTIGSPTFLICGFFSCSAIPHKNRGSIYKTKIITNYRAALKIKRSYMNCKV